MKCWSLAAWPAVKVLPLVGMVSLMLPLAALAQTPPTFTPQQQAFLDELKGRVSSRLYQSRIRNQPDTYVLVGEGACQEMREQGYAAVIRKQNSTSGPMILQNQPQGNGSYRGQLQLQMGRTVVEAARKHLCPDAPERR
jgi:hypothetical protein